MGAGGASGLQMSGAILKEARGFMRLVSVSRACESGGMLREAEKERSAFRSLALSSSVICSSIAVDIDCWPAQRGHVAAP